VPAETQRLLQNATLSLDDFDLRVSAISPANQSFLTQLKAWQSIPATRLAYYQQMHVWDGDGGGAVHFDAADVARPHLGVIVENRVLQAALLQRLHYAPNVTLLPSRDVKQLTPQEKGMMVTLEDGSQLASRLLVAADGAHSAIRQKLGVDCEVLPYQQTAFVANLHTQRSHDYTAWQRFTRSGPVAFLPLPDPHWCSIVWSVDDSDAQRLQRLDTTAFAKELSTAFEHRLGEVKLACDIAAFPLVKRHAAQYLVPHGALIGDAAHTVHPLAGQGVNLGFQDALILSRVIRAQLAKGRDFALTANLREFERERKAQNRLVQETMSGLKWLFGSSNMAMTLGRNWGLSLVDRVPAVTQFFIHQAMGL